MVGNGWTFPQALLLQPAPDHPILLPSAPAGHLQCPLLEAGSGGLTLSTVVCLLCLALSHLTWPDTCPQVQALFRREYSEVVSVSAPTRLERNHFFRDLVLHQAAEAAHTQQQTQQHMLAPFSGDDPLESPVSYNFNGGNSPPLTGRSL